MKASNLEYILKEIPLLAGLTDQQRRRITKKALLLEFSKGQVIYKEGSPPSYFYCIIRGRALICTQDRYGKQTVLEYLHRGKYFGVISVLTGDPHSVTAKAINDCLLLAIKKEDFEDILKVTPQLAIDLSRTLSRRLKHKDVHQKTVFESTIIAALSSYPQAGKTIYASNLAFSIAKEAHKAVIIVDICPPDTIHRMPRVLDSRGNYRVFNLSSRLQTVSDIKNHIIKDKFGVDILYLTYTYNHDFWQKTVVDILSLLVNDYHYIVLDLPCCRERAILNILNQADMIHILSSPKRQDLRSTRTLIKRLEKDFFFAPEKIKVIINEARPSKLSLEEELDLLGRGIFAVLPQIKASASGRLVLERPDSEYAKVVRRISRQEADCLVGLALGVGVAYGFCHVGILRVIEDEKIPVDVISGSSMGAIIASLWSIGWSSQEILEMISREFKEPRYIWGLLDFTFPLLGFFKGNKLYSFLKKYLGNKTFYDVKVPLRIIASDVKRKQTRILDTGSLVDALMASCAMPGVFAPFRLKGELLFDGGVINPLPTEPLFEMGVKKIIAVNLTPSREDIVRQFEQIKQDVSADPAVIKHPEWFSIKKYLRDKFKTNILDFVFSSFEIMQSEVALKEAQLADVVLHPDVSGLHWLELHRADEFAKRGEEEARKNLEKITKLINE